MIDLTPLDVRKKRGDFSKQLRGYDPNEVDSFLELVAERLETIVKENLTLQERSARLGDQVESSVGRERAVQEALVTAQELREDILSQARREADLVGREADSEAEQTRRAVEIEVADLRRAARSEVDRVIGDAMDRVEEVRVSMQELERRRGRFLKAFRGLLEREMEDIEVEEAKPPLEEGALDIEMVTETLETSTTTDIADLAPEGENPPAVDDSAGVGETEVTVTADTVAGGVDDRDEAEWATTLAYGDEGNASDDQPSTPDA